MGFSDPDSREYYAMVVEELPGFWSRFGGKPDFKGKKVLDLGCGHGALVNDIAQGGAVKVVGLDLEQSHIDFASEYQQKLYPELSDIVEFVTMDIRNYPEYDFDYMVSKATFEHVLELESVVVAMGDRLKLGGRLYTGFGPLYYSPFGDHSRTTSRLPWEHTFRSDQAIVERVNRTRAEHEKITAVTDLGLNKLTPAEYRQIFEQSGMNIILYKENVVMPKSGFKRRFVATLMDTFKTIPFLEKYMTVNIWCVLEK